MRKVIIPHNGEVIYEGKDIRVEIIGIDLWITPKTQRIRRNRKKHYITKAKPIPMMTRGICRTIQNKEPKLGIWIAD